jgi:hypothetical protein
MEGTFKKRLAVIGAGLGLLATPALLTSGFAYQQGSPMQLAATKGKKAPKKPTQEIFELVAKGKKKEKKPKENFSQASVMQLAAAKKGKKAPKKPQTPPPSSPSM